MKMWKIFICTVATIALHVSAVTVNQAIAVLKNDQGLQGTITFNQTDNGVVVSGSITGLSEGEHGFHIHQKGDLTSGADCLSTGPHFNPTAKKHGSPADDERHVGDLGNIKADKTTCAIIDITDKLISLNGENSIIGRAIVVHADPDDLGKGNATDSTTSGHAGVRLACAVIGVVDSSAPSLAFSSMAAIITSAVFLALRI